MARWEAPNEACGAIFYRDSEALLIPMKNDHEIPTSYYRFDPSAWVTVCLEMDKTGYRPLVIFHSHPRGNSYPSMSDMSLAIDGILYLIYSPKDGFYLWEISDGKCIEESIMT